MHRKVSNKAHGKLRVYEPHCTLTGAAGALRLAGVTTVRDCSFVSNTAYDKALAVLAVGSVEIYGSSFHKNVFLCGEGQYLKKNPEVCNVVRLSF